MKSRLSVLLAGFVAAALSAPVVAMPSGATLEKSPGAYPLDCAKDKDKARCEQLNRDIQACKDKLGDEWRECMRQPAPAAKFTPPRPRDCSAARNKELCDAHTSALEACKDRTTRAEHRKCMAGPPPSVARGKS